VVLLSTTYSELYWNAFSTERLHLRDAVPVNRTSELSPLMLPLAWFSPLDREDIQILGGACNGENRRSCASSPNRRWKMKTGLSNCQDEDELSHQDAEASLGLETQLFRARRRWQFSTSNKWSRSWSYLAFLSAVRGEFIIWNRKKIRSNAREMKSIVGVQARSERDGNCYMQLLYVWSTETP
jgi:hypothetical protein